MIEVQGSTGGTSAPSRFKEIGGLHGLASLAIYCAAALLGCFILSSLTQSPWPLAFIARHNLAGVAIVCLAFGLFGLTSQCFAAYDEAHGPRTLPTHLIPLGLGFVSLALFGFCVYFGNQQFAGFDHSFLIDLGWRLYNHQNPFIDFDCNFPPAFLLGVKYAFQFGGPRWDSQLYLTGIFTAGTFVWMYLLFARLIPSRITAAAFSLCIEVISSLVLAFWWYNPSASVAGAVFLLSCICYWKFPESKLFTGSLVASLFLIEGMKPNTAAPLVLGTVVIFALFGPYKVRTLVLLASTSLLFIGFLYLNHLPFPEVLSGYVLASKSRGLGEKFGIRDYGGNSWRILLVEWFTLMSPLIFSVWDGAKAIGRRQFPRLGLDLLLILGLVTGTMAGITNGEAKSVDMPLFVVSGAVVFFGRPELGSSVRAYFSNARTWRFFRNFYAAFIFAMSLLALTDSVTRYRIYTVGYRSFFEIQAGDSPATPFFPNLRTGERFVRVLGEERTVLNSRLPGPVFLGPRLEFGYAQFNLPSPRGYPVLWDPGTLFPVNQAPRILQTWRDHHFRTLIFLKGDYTFYTPEFLRIIRSAYSVDESYRELTVYRRK